MIINSTVRGGIELKVGVRIGTGLRLELGQGLEAGQGLEVGSHLSMGRDPLRAELPPSGAEDVRLVLRLLARLQLHHHLCWLTVHQRGGVGDERLSEGVY